MVPQPIIQTERARVDANVDVGRRPGHEIRYGTQVYVAAKFRMGGKSGRPGQSVAGLQSRAHRIACQRRFRSLQNLLRQAIRHRAPDDVFVDTPWDGWNVHEEISKREIGQGKSHFDESPKIGGIMLVKH